jgi:hypothetical protein
VGGYATHSTLKISNFIRNLEAFSADKEIVKKAKKSVNIKLLKFLTSAFFVAFSSVVRQMPGKNRKDGTRPALFLIFVLFYALFVFFYVLIVFFYALFVFSYVFLCRSLYCLCVNVY